MVNKGDWKTYEMGELLSYEQPTPYIVNSTEYNESYKIPVLTAGKSFIIGKTNETDGIYQKLPVIIFDDFTTATQYVNFKFKVKSSAMKILTANKELVDTKYLFYRMQFIKKDHNTHKRYWIQTYSKIKITIPSIEEQKYIVTKIEELFLDLEDSIADLKYIKEKLKVYKQAILQEMFKRKYDRIKLSDISSIFGGYAFRSSRYDINGNYVVVKIGNVKNGNFDFSRDLTKTNECNEMIEKKYLLKKDDCLITMTGSRAKRDYGYVMIMGNEPNWLLNQRVSAIRFDKNKAISKFFYYYFMTDDFRNQFFLHETGNVGQGNVGIKALSDAEVIYPSINCQLKLVDELESQLSYLHYLEDTIVMTMKQSYILRQSILKKAFEGSLV